MLYRTTARRAVVHARLRPVVDSALRYRFAQASSLHTTPDLLAVKLNTALRLSSAAHRGYATTRSTGTQTRKSASKTASKKAAGAKKPATKKKPKKAAAKKKPAPKKKKAKKVLSADQKLVEKVRALKQQALLDEPKYQPVTVWNLLVQQSHSPVTAASMRESSNRFKSLSAGERQQMQTTIDANKRSNAALKRQFVANHSPFEIYRANLARSALGKIGRSRATGGHKRALVSKKSFSPLLDPRAPKRPNTGYFRFFLERRQQGAVNGSSVAEQARDATRQWEALPAEQRKRYNDAFAAELEAYAKEVQSLMPERFQKKVSTRSRAKSS